MSNMEGAVKETRRRIEQLIAHKVQEYKNNSTMPSSDSDETMVSSSSPKDKAAQNTSKNNSKRNVKNEHEREIEEVAKKIRENNAKKMSMLRNAEQRQLRSNSDLNKPTPSSTTSTESHPGKFGWETVENVFIPYVLVDDKKFLSKRIVFDKVFKNSERYFKEEIFTCLRWRFSPLTESEASLFNEINTNHSDFTFGRERFTTKDLKITYDDFLESYNFLLFCYAVLVLKDPKKFPAKCGFVRINQENIVPYILRDTKKYVPLFYFETGSSFMLEPASVELTFIEMYYLRFCCKVQEIKKQFYEVPSCKALEIEQVSSLLPPNSTVVDHWPKINASAFLNTAEVAKISVVNGEKSTFISSGSDNGVITANKQSNSPANMMDSYRLTSVPTVSNKNTTTSYPKPRGVRKPSGVTNYNNFRPNTGPQNGPPALIPYNGRSVIAPSSNKTAYSSITKTSQSCYQAPIVFVTNPENINNNLASFVTTASSVTSNGSKNIAVKSSSSIIHVNKLPPLLLGANPYKITNKSIWAKLMTCVNLNANELDTSLLVSVDDICSKLFYDRPANMIEEALRFLGLDFYRLNEDQVKVKVKESLNKSFRDNEWFVLYDSFLEFLPQISYMVQNKKISTY